MNPSVLSLAVLSAVLALPVQAGERELDDLSLEELVKLEVATVARKAQKLSDTPAAVTVLSADDIRRSGARSIPEALREVPGVNVAQIGAARWAVSVRGFNGRFSNKLLVQIDGRSVYSPLFSGVFWEAIDVMLEDVERIEVVRGPGASLWGANAVNGIINIVTRKATATQGTLGAVSVDDRGAPVVAAINAYWPQREGDERAWAQRIADRFASSPDGINKTAAAIEALPLPLAHEGRVGVGRSGGRFKPRVVVAVALDEDDKVCDSLIMRGMTVFARPAKIQAINGLSLQELQPDVIFPNDPLCQNALSLALNPKHG